MLNKKKKKKESCKDERRTRKGEYRLRPVRPELHSILMGDYLPGGITSVKQEKFDKIYLKIRIFLTVPECPYNNSPDFHINGITQCVTF